MILHITRRELWDEALRSGSYRADTLDSEGFIHCSTPEQVLGVAKAVYRGQPGLVLLCIETAAVRPQIRYEGSGAENFPHIYGPLNADAVTRVLAFEPGPDGLFTLPDEI